MFVIRRWPIRRARWWRLPRWRPRSRATSPSRVPATVRRACPRQAACRASSRSRRNHGRTCSRSSAYGGRSMRPSTLTPGNSRAQASRTAATPSRRVRTWWTRAARSTWMRIGRSALADTAARDNRSTRSRLCTDWTPANAPGSCWPCWTGGGRSGASGVGRSAVSVRLARASWTRFSPKSTCPAAWAARTASAPNVLLTATRRTASGDRPLRVAALAMRARTAASRPATTVSSASRVHSFGLIESRMPLA